MSPKSPRRDRRRAHRVKPEQPTLEFVTDSTAEPCEPEALDAALAELLLSLADDGAGPTAGGRAATVPGK